MNFAALPARAAAAPGLARWGRHLTAQVLVDAGDQAVILAIRDGMLVSAGPAPSLMPRFDLALRFAPDGLVRFLANPPPPGWHDLMALMRHGALRVEGDLQPFMAHLFWFKGLFALLREDAA
ncbi:hypothetical protein GXW78_08830 [Roseomonas terrae]|jgi:hypothetical protein|uniref:SCP2 domain-containing protein n=1 Tax=Neoroseomonas terrae TaxID=424799 RepID=A0ABS5EFH3_9PROT|nr:hypothetical protein [Neoroseomonas terrae]MBR0649765.1 hypothetical protein [Neoroseomonas terrae]